MEAFETLALAEVEAKDEIPPLLALRSNLRSISGRGTLSGGEFDWGGRLQNGNGGVQRSAQPDWKPGGECIGISGLDCKTNKSNRYESRSK